MFPHATVLAQFMPHGFCYRWSEPLILLHVISDALIATAYFCIPIVLAIFLAKRRDIRLPWLTAAFATFILACGMTHVMEIWSVWQPSYWLSGGIKALTAAASITTAFALVRNFGAMLALPTPAQLHSTQQRLQRITDCLPVLVGYIDSEERYQFTNKTYEDWFGVSSRSLLGKKIDEVLDPRTYAIVKPFVKQALAGERVFFERDLIESSTKRFVRAEYIPDTHDGKTVGFYVLVTDLTNRRRQEQELFASESRFRNTFEFGGAGMAIVGLDGRFIRVNKQLCKIVGYPEAELLDKRFQDITHPEDLETDLAQANDLLTGRIESYEMEKRYIHKDGHAVWVMLSASMVRDELNHASYYVAHIQDIQQRKDLESQLIEANRTLKTEASQLLNRLQAVLQTAPIVLWAVDKNGLFTMLEGSGGGPIGLDYSHLIGKSQLELVRDESIDSYNDTKRALAGEAFVAVHPHKGRWFQTSYSPIRNDRGEVIEVVGVSIDVSDSKEAEHLKVAEASAREASRLKSEFLANMSHEVRTPMNGILGMSTLLMASPLNAEQQQMGRVIKRSAEALMAILDDILDFSKIEAGKFRIASVAFELRPVIEEAVALFRSRATEKGLALSLTVDESAANPVVGDPQRIRQVFLNLLSNAIKFTQAGRVEASVSLLGRAGAGIRVRIQVSDTGIGIPDEFKRTLFNPFEQANGGSTRRYGGTGLGLAISRQLVQLMGGTMDFESSEGRGSRFWFDLELPLAGPDAPPAPEIPPAFLAPPKSETAAPIESAIRPSARPLRIIVADDNYSNRLVAQMILEKMGHAVETVNDGRALVEILRSEHFDLAFCDCQMPEMDGYEAVRRIRSGDSGDAARSLPIIALTAYAMPEDRTKCLDAGMDDYISKPLLPESARVAIERTLSRKTTPNKRAETSPGGPVIDRNLVEKLMDGDRAFFAKLVAAFRRDYPNQLEALRSAAAARNGSSAGKSAHSIAGACSIVGGRRAQHHALSLEKVFQEGRWTEADRLTAELAAELAMLDEAVAEYV